MAKLGTEKKPVHLQVRSGERGEELRQICIQNGWRFIIDVEPDETEDIFDLEKLQWTLIPYKAPEKIGRNAPCPCGSGKKYKKCCG